MIRLTDSLTEHGKMTAELLKIKCLYDCYKDDRSVMFWTQDGDRAVISMTDGNMIIFNNGADTDELSEFTAMLSPVCVFSDIDTLNAIGCIPEERITVMHRKADTEGETPGDSLSSRELYDLLDVKGLSLPDYPHFAVDYCRRLNNGAAEYFAIKGKCAAITFNSGEFAVMNGIASHEKGYGTVALNAVLQKNRGRDFFVCCRDTVKGFYEKNGFRELYYAGYWVKKIEHNRIF